MTPGHRALFLMVLHRASTKDDLIVFTLISCLYCYDVSDSWVVLACMFWIFLLIVYQTNKPRATAVHPSGSGC